jgi:hypothetical protein
MVLLVCVHAASIVADMNKAELVGYLERVDRELKVAAVEAAVGELPEPFNKDALVLENLENFKVDITLWGGVCP